MGKSASNIVILLGLVLMVVAAYFVYQQQGSVLDSSVGQLPGNVLQETKSFIGYTSVLKSIKLDFTLFEDERFTKLRNFSAPIEESPAGRLDPFSVPLEMQMDFPENN
jgi:hypothetical protein